MEFDKSYTSVNWGKPCKETPMPFEHLTKIKGDHTRHIEQLWDEINKLKEEVKKLKEKT